MLVPCPTIAPKIDTINTPITGIVLLKQAAKIASPNGAKSFFMLIVDSKKANI